MLIALPQSPEARRPDLHPKAAIVARKRVLDRLANEDVVAADLAAESAEYPAAKRRDFPSTAWHASEEAVARATKPPDDIATTLDMPLQKELETPRPRCDRPRARRHPDRDHGRGYSHAAKSAPLSDPPTAPRQAAGSTSPIGRARPGSTLKPFIYGLAFDDGIASPDTRIADAPRRFATYRPDNFDRTFRGDVTVARGAATFAERSGRHGARQSRRAPLRLGAGLRRRRARHAAEADDDAGLAIALGGAGLTVRELALLYAALGDGGRALPLYWLKSESAAARPPKSIRQRPRSCRLHRLTPDRAHPRRRPRAGRPHARLADAGTRPVIAFKTGTSYGFRDAWAAGVSGGNAVVVMDGPRRWRAASGRHRTGRRAAGAVRCVRRHRPHHAPRASGPALRDGGRQRIRRTARSRLPVSTAKTRRRKFSFRPTAPKSGPMTSTMRSFSPPRVVAVSPGMSTASRSARTSPANRCGGLPNQVSIRLQLSIAMDAPPARG